MRVFINNTGLTIFSGARLSEIILAYSGRSFKMLKNGHLNIYDRFGNLTEPDGPSFDGQRFFLKKKPRKKLIIDN